MLIYVCSFALYNLGLYEHKRTAATHILVVMISTESRSQKPYALSVQCLSYLGMTVKQMRGLLNRLLVAMVERNMDVNGELMGISIYSTVFTVLYMYVYVWCRICFEWRI